jgi:catechol-2,3-dioxygenase
MHVHFALSISRAALEAAAGDLDGVGEALEGPVVHEDGDRSIYVFDPEGNRVELWDTLDGRPDRRLSRP